MNLEEQKAQMQDKFLSGRQIAWKVNEYFRVTGANEVVLDSTDLFSITFRGDDIDDNLDGKSLQEEQKGKYQRESGSGQKELIGRN